MSNYYTDIYSKRINRYGHDFQSRIEGQRAKEFDNFLLKSPNRVDFEFDGELIAAVLEQYKQDATETQGYLLTRKETLIPNGTIINLVDKNNQDHFWLVWWLEQIKTSGYHRYVILKMTHQFSWATNTIQQQWGYLSSPGENIKRDSNVLGVSGSIVKENNNYRMLVTKYQSTFDRDGYLEIPNGEKVDGYRIVETEMIDGIHYLSLEPIAKKPLVAAPVKTDGTTKEELFWFGGAV